MTPFPAEERSVIGKPLSVTTIATVVVANTADVGFRRQRQAAASANPAAFNVTKQSPPRKFK
jgi:hypothetical protein